jgi:hypothetical protein
MSYYSREVRNSNYDCIGYEFTLSTGRTFYIQRKNHEATDQMLKSLLGFRWNPPREWTTRFYNDGTSYEVGPELYPYLFKESLYYEDLCIYPGKKDYIIIPDYDFYPKEYEEKWLAFFKG